MSVHSFLANSWLTGNLQMDKIIAHLFLDYMATFREIQYFWQNPELSVSFYPLLEANFQDGSSFWIEWRHK